MGTSTVPHALPEASQPVDLLIIAGEHSGDAHAATLLASMKAKQPNVRVCALGGPKLADAGADLLFDLTAHSVVGLVEVLKHYHFFKALLDNTIDWIAKHQPGAVCFVDYPGFNLRVAKALYRRGLANKAGGPCRLLYYIGPQIWAWKRHRRFTMAQWLDSLAVIFPFEVDSYADTTLDVHFVGHPFVTSSHTPVVRYAADGPVLLLPGSRSQPVARILPRLLAAWQQFRATHPDRDALILYPSEAIREQIEAIIAGQPSLEGLQLMPSEPSSYVASAALMSSGTMSLEVALAGIPGAIVYVAHPLTYRVGRAVVNIRWIGIANLLLGAEAWPEFLQGDATPSALAQQLQGCVRDPNVAQQAHQHAIRLRDGLLDASAVSPEGWLIAELEKTSPTGGRSGVG